MNGVAVVELEPDYYTDFVEVDPTGRYGRVYYYSLFCYSI
jgi:hypothetical protein